MAWNTLLLKLALRAVYQCEKQAKRDVLEYCSSEFLCKSIQGVVLKNP